MFKHLLVPTDGTPLSTDAAERAVSFAKEAGARITFFFSKPDYPLAFYGEGALIDPVTPDQFAKMANEQASRVLSQCEEIARRGEVQFATASAVSDHPYEGIVEAAKNCGADIIFMASHGRRGISAILLGSETQKVLTHSKIPVLVYR